MRVNTASREAINSCLADWASVFVHAGKDWGVSQCLSRSVAPHCKRTLNVSERAFGKTVPCPGCGQPVTAPRQSMPLQPMCPVEPKAQPLRVVQATHAASPPPTRNARVPPAPCPPVAVHATLAGKQPVAPDVEQETGTCTWCRKAMPSDALQCPWCRNWRRDIHLLIQTYRELALWQIATAIISGLLIAGAFFLGLPDAMENNKLLERTFSFEKFLNTPSFDIIVLVVVLTVVVYVPTQVHAVRCRHRIQQATKGLWIRPWWTF